MTRGAVALTVAALALTLSHPAAQSRPTAGIRGLSDAPALAAAYDAILDANFTAVAPRLRDMCVTTPAWCDVMAAVSWWWQITLDPADRQHDGAFAAAAEQAIRSSDAWAARDPRRAEAWFAVGAAYGARAQFRVARDARLAAARDGKRIRTALERALALDPGLHDAKFGLGMYRYYADVAPAALRVLRWILLLPGGNRRAGLQQMIEAREHGLVVRDEADYQLHQIYLWYENRPHDALALVRGLHHRHPRSPLFPLIEARIHDVYFHDRAASAQVLRALIARARAREINAAPLAIRRAESALRALDAPAPR